MSVHHHWQRNAGHINHPDRRELPARLPPRRGAAVRAQSTSSAAREGPCQQGKHAEALPGPGGVLVHVGRVEPK